MRTKTKLLLLSPVFAFFFLWGMSYLAVSTGLYTLPEGPTDYGTVEEKQIEKISQTAKMKQLPDSCKGVNSIETELYPTGPACLSALLSRTYDMCESLTDGNRSQTEKCVDDFKERLAQQCANPTTGSTEVCIMYIWKELYPKMIPE